MKNFKNYCHLHKFAQVAIFALILFATSCSKEEIPETTSNLNSITSFYFSKSDNPSLSGEVPSVVAGRVIYLTIPEGISLSGLKPGFTISPKATISYNGSEISSGKSLIDF